MRRSRSCHNRAGRDVVEHKDAILPLAKACRYPALHRLLTRDLAIRKLASNAGQRIRTTTAPLRPARRSASAFVSGFLLSLCPAITS